jgi:hypothetical protein
MLAVVWTNPEAIPRSPRSVERCTVDGRELIIVGGHDVWSVHAGRNRFEESYLGWWHQASKNYCPGTGSGVAGSGFVKNSGASR